MWHISGLRLHALVGSLPPSPEMCHLMVPSYRRGVCLLCEAPVCRLISCPHQGSFCPRETGGSFCRGAYQLDVEGRVQVSVYKLFMSVFWTSCVVPATESGMGKLDVFLFIPRLFTRAGIAGLGQFELVHFLHQEPLC